jgi:hypothetical protein
MCGRAIARPFLKLVLAAGERGRLVWKADSIVCSGMEAAACTAASD